MPKVACKVNLPGTQEHFNVLTYFSKKKERKKKKRRMHCKPRAAEKYVYLFFTGAVQAKPTEFHYVSHL